MAASPEAMAAKKALPFVVVPAMAMPIGVRWPSRAKTAGQAALAPAWVRERSDRPKRKNET